MSRRKFVIAATFGTKRSGQNRSGGGTVEKPAGQLVARTAARAGHRDVGVIPENAVEVAPQGGREHAGHPHGGTPAAKTVRTPLERRVCDGGGGLCPESVGRGADKRAGRGV